MNNRVWDVRDENEPLPVGEGLLGVLPFLLFGLANITVELWPGGLLPRQPEWLNRLANPFQWTIALMFLGLAAGILRGFPRWAFSYLGWVVLLELLWADPLLPVWGMLPAVAVVVRGWQQRGQVFRPRFWRDLTLLPLALYILFTALYMIYDENHHPALLLFMSGSALAAGLGAWGFYRSTSPLRRAAALTTGLALVIALQLWNGLTWDARAYYGLVEDPNPTTIRLAVVIWLVVAAITISTGWLAAWLTRRRNRTVRQAAPRQ